VHAPHNYRHIVSLRAALLLLLFLDSARAGGVDPTKVSLPKGPGSIEGLATADFSPSLATGTASYEVPLALPPGAAGAAPKLSIAYDSGGGVTEIGIGWRLAGPPKLRRRIREGLPAFDATDVFELVGLGVPSDLVQVRPNVFRPAIEDGTFVRVERTPDGHGWEARTKAGAIYAFGGAGHEESEGDRVAAYLLREERDRHGHCTTYEWDASEGHALLTHVTWNAFDDASTNEVLLTYGARPDPHVSFASGIREAFFRRLESIEVRHGGAPVRRYDLSYGREAHPTLQALTLTGADGTTRMPASRFTYTEARFAASSDQLVTMSSPPGRTPSDGDTSLVDLNGDGLPDFLVAEAGRFRSYVNHDGKRWRAAQAWGTASPSVSLSSQGVTLADLDADGAPDLVVKSGTKSFRYFPRPAETRFDPPVALASVPGFSLEDADVRLADMDGDRRMDVVVTTEAGIAVGYNRAGADFTEPEVEGPVDPGETPQPVRFSDGHTSVCDVNGDRVVDLCSLRPGGLSYWLGRGRGRFEPGKRAAGVPDFDPSTPYQLVDLNGDGWVDLVRVGATEVSVALAEGEGAFAPILRIGGVPARGPATAVEFADMNGSGTTDIVWVDVSQDGSAAWRYLEPFPDGRAGLLARIDNGLGKVQTIEYAPAALEAARAREEDQPWQTRLNVAMPVVVRWTSDVSLGDAAAVTELAYRDGAYDPVERTFAGFGGAERRQLGDDSTPTLLTELTFDQGLAHRELRGALLGERTSGADGRVFTLRSNGYTSRRLETGERGEVHYSFCSSVTVKQVEGDPGSARSLLTESEQDEYGNVVEERAWGDVTAGKVEGGDEHFVTRTFANDPGEWLLGFVATEEHTDAMGRRVSFAKKYYDGAATLGKVIRGDPTREEAWVGPGEGDFELVLETRYDTDGLPVETTDARGGGRIFSWAADHTSIQSERVKLDGDVELVEKADVDGATGNLLAVTDYAGQTTRYEYDPLGRLTKVVKPGDTEAAPTVEYAYEARAPLSRVVTTARVRSGEGDVERSEVLFDGSGRKRGTLTRDGDRWIFAGVSLLDARGAVRRSLLPRAISASEYRDPPLLDAVPAGTDVFHDALGREVRTRSLTGIETRTEYAPLVTRHYDGGQTDASSPYEHTPTLERKDGLGRIVEHVKTLNGATLSARYTYDAEGRLLTRTDPEGNVSTYSYDGRGRRIGVRDPDHGAHRFVVDAMGNVVEHRHPDGKVGRFAFDLAGRSLSEDWDGDGTPEVVRTWDRANRKSEPSTRGKLVRVTEPSGSVEHTYDSRGRVTATRYEIDGTVYVSGSEYDAQDRETRHVYPDGTSIQIRRNERGQVAAYGDAIRFEYRDDGLERVRRLSTGAAAETGYDGERRRSELTVTAAGGSIIEHLRWAYDSGGSLIRVADLRADVPAERDRSERYDYDNLYRLVGARGAWGKTSYRYSNSGNLTGRTSTVPDQDLPDVGYGERPHLPAMLGSRRVEADARGRITADGERVFTWNDADQLVEVTRTDGASTKSIYGAEGVRRIRVERKPDGTETTTHFIDAWAEASGGELRRYVVHAGQRIVRLGDDAAGASTPVKPSPPASRAPATPTQGAFALLLLFSLIAVGRCVSRRGRSAIAGLNAFARRSRPCIFTARRRPAPVVLGLATVLAVAAVAACGHDTSRPGEAPPRPHHEIRALDAGDTFIVTDLLGSVLSETTAEGESKATFATYPFGATRYDTSHATCKYAGAPRDGAVGLDHMGARFYAPELGIWTSPDPVTVTAPERLVTADFAAANPYAYANQTPLIAADRDGHFWHIIAGGLIGAAVNAGTEALHQYLDHGKVDDYGRIGAAAAGGCVSGMITAAFPGAAIEAHALGGAAGGITRRLIESGGKSAGTAKDVLMDGAAGAITAGATKGAAQVLKAAAPKVAGGAGALARVARASAGESAGGDGLSLRFSQTTASSRFSLQGAFSGRTVGGLAAELRSGAVSASDVPVQYVSIQGNDLIVNTRSALALGRAGIPQNEWNLIDATQTQSGNILDRLSSNGLTIEGSMTIRITGLGRAASNLE
jgi:RHS repeat-associated protein